MATFPAFYLRKQATTVAYLNSLTSRNVPLAANNYVGSNYSRYQDPDYDAGVTRFFSTIDPGDRMAALRPLIGQISDQLLTMGLFLDTPVAAVNNRVRGVTSSNVGWNVQDWDV
jgi:hypothetical protein